MKNKFFCDDLSGWRVFGFGYGVPSEHGDWYIGLYLWKWSAGFGRYKDNVKQAVVKTEDLRKDI